MNVPKGWKSKLLKETTNWNSGGTPPMRVDSYWNGSIPWVSASTMQGHAFETSTKFITEEGLKSGSKLAVKNSLLLLVRGSMLWNKIPVGIAKKDLAFNQDVKSITAKPIVLPLFLLYWFLSNENKLRHMVTGTGIGAGKLDTQELLSLKIFLPPLPEQQKIAEILSVWDRAIEVNEGLIKNSLLQKKALMQQLLTAKKRLKGFDREWEEIEFGKLGETYSGLSGKIKKDFGKGKSYIPYKNVFKYSCVNFSFLDKVNIKKGEKQNIAQHGDIIFTTSSEIPEEVGMSSIVVEPIESLYLNSFCFGFRPENLSQLMPLFSAQYFRSPYMRRLISSLAQGSTRYNLSKKGLMKLKLTLPPSDEQTAIAAILSDADRETELLAQKLTHLKQEKSALMQQLLTGKRRVKIDKKKEIAA